jgi:hypothetical protein
MLCLLMWFLEKGQGASVLETISAVLKQVFVLLSIWWVWLQIQEHRRKK